MTGGVAFVNPVNPGLYPAIATNVAAGTRAREEAVHKGLVPGYEIFCGVEAGLKDIITHILRALAVPRNTCEENKEQTNFRHGLVQTQVLHSTTRNSSGPD